MSDDEEVMHSDEEEGADEAPSSPPKRAEDTGPSEAQAAMQKRRQQQSHSGLDEDAQELLEANKEERAKMEEEINELRHRSELRRRERVEEEKRLAVHRQEEDQKRKAEEEDRKKKKEDEERSKKDARSAKMAEFEKWKNPPTPNFVISKKDRPDVDDDEGEEEEQKKSKEQLQAEKKATLKQRITPLEISGFDASKLSDKAKELHSLIYRLESEKYDLERRFKAQQYDMMELAERARSSNKVGKQGSLKRIQLNEEDSDLMQERFAGCPARVIMYSEYERQKDKRDFVNRRGIYTGPVYGYPADRIKPQKIVRWSEEGLPQYEEDPNAEPIPEEVPAEEVPAEGEE